MARSATPKAASAAAAQAETYLRLDGSPMPAILPAAVTMLSPYGFLDDDGNSCWWQVNQVVDDAADIVVLIARGAPISYDEPTPEQSAAAQGRADEIAEAVRIKDAEDDAVAASLAIEAAKSIAQSGA